MRRNARLRRNETNLKSVLFLSGIIFILALITFGITYAIYSNKVKSEARVSMLNSRSIGELVPNTRETESAQSASVAIGKTVNEVKDETGMEIEKRDEEKSIENNETLNYIINRKPLEDESNEETEQITKTDEKMEETQEENNIEEKQEDEISFILPVEGEIYREYAKDDLVYSDTLKEWITHNGIDIKADKTTVVKAAETGKIKSIKNDPRYGITVIIEHNDGFKTVYSNLLSTEFISEEEEVKKGQSIGTVGSSASFEVADEPHLHFEIWKDEEAVNPQIYIK